MLGKKTKNIFIINIVLRKDDDNNLVWQSASVNYFQEHSTV